MEKFDIRKYKYSLIMLGILFLFALMVSNAYKYLPDNNNISNEVVEEQVDDDAY